METFIEIAKNGGLSIAGLLIYSLIAIKDNIWRFSFKIFIKDNKPFWIWSLALQIIFSVLITVFPDSGDAIKTLSGIDLTQPMAFLSSGAVLAKLANYASRKTLNTEIGKK